jgi:hypothetical protein
VETTKKMFIVVFLPTTQKVGHTKYAYVLYVVDHTRQTAFVPSIGPIRTNTGLTSIKNKYYVYAV